MEKLNDSAAHQDEFGDAPESNYLEFVRIDSSNAHILAGTTVLRVSGDKDSLRLEAWMLSGLDLGADPEQSKEIRLLGAEALWSAGNEPDLLGVITTDCFEKTAAALADENRAIARLSQLFNNTNGQPGAPKLRPSSQIADPTEEEERDYRLRGERGAILDLIGKFADVSFLRGIYSRFTDEFPGIIVTAAHPDEHWPRVEGAWFDYYWVFTVEEGLFVLHIEDKEHTRLWSAAMAGETIIAEEDREYFIHHGVASLPKSLTTPFRELLNNLEPSLFPYRFKPRGKAAERHVQISYGRNPLEAFEALSARLGIAQNMLDKCFVPDPLEIDNREWPNAKPSDLFAQRNVPKTLTLQVEPFSRIEFEGYPY